MFGKATQEMSLYGKTYFGPAESEILCMRGRSMQESREISKVSGISNFPTGAVGEVGRADLIDTILSKIFMESISMFNSMGRDHVNFCNHVLFFKKYTLF